MTTTAEERAKDIHDRLFRLNKYHFEKVSMAPLEFITAAIVSAQNDKLEEARQRVLEGHDEAWGNPAEQHGWDQAAQRIEALKSKD